MTQSIYEHQVSFKDSSLRGLIYGSAAFCLFLLACMVLYIIYQGFAAMSWQFVSTATSATKGIVGILGNIINTLYVVACTLAMAVPLGVGSAIYLNEYAKRGRLVKAIEFTTEILAGIPSIISHECSWSWCFEMVHDSHDYLA